MATTTGRRKIVQQEEDGDRSGRQVDASAARQAVSDQLEELARHGTRTILMVALNEEVGAYLGRGRYERFGDSLRRLGDGSGEAEADFRGYRNGTSPCRLTLGSGTIDLAMPRRRDIPAGREPFESRILRRYQRRSGTIDQTFLKLFIEGLATRDFEPALRLLVGQNAPLSPSTISRLLSRFRAEYEVFDRRDLSGTKFVYLWADGIYLKAVLGTEKACLLVLIGADTNGQKHLNDLTFFRVERMRALAGFSSLGRPTEASAATAPPARRRCHTPAGSRCHTHRRGRLALDIRCQGLGYTKGWATLPGWRGYHAPYA